MAAYAKAAPPATAAAWISPRARIHSWCHAARTDLAGSRGIPLRAAGWAHDRTEGAAAFDAAGRPDQAAAERAEGEVLSAYLPAQLSDEELAVIVARVIAETGASGPAAMGQVMKAVTPLVAGRAEGGRVAAEVRRGLAG